MPKQNAGAWNVNAIHTVSETTPMSRRLRSNATVACSAPVPATRCERGLACIFAEVAPTHGHCMHGRIPVNPLICKVCVHRTVLSGLCGGLTPGIIAYHHHHGS
jgi:hypothetical protein